MNTALVVWKKKMKQIDENSEEEKSEIDSEEETEEETEESDDDEKLKELDCKFNK